MKITRIILPAAIAAIALLHACKKTASTTVDATLSAQCAHPFIGAADSATLYLATAFTPNGNGINDVYRIASAKTNTFTTFTEHIYKTDGTLVFTNTNPTAGWEGTDASGNKLTDYKYFVKIKYTTPGGISVDTGTYVFRLSSSATCTNRVLADTALYLFPDQIDPITGAHYATMETFCN